MPRLDPAVAAVRLAVRRGLPVITDDRGRAWVPDLPGRRLARHGTVLVACSGGPDSMALLAATLFELRRTRVRVVGAVVDHGLQEGSAEHTAAVVSRMRALGVDEAESVRVRVDAGPRGLEAGARRERYAALALLARRHGAGRVLLGHTRDDQAETVLLGLTQGSGPRSIAGMREELEDDDGIRWSRPLLGVTREQTRRACAAEGIEVWDDPHNADPRFVRSRVRQVVLPLLERELGPGIAAALARTGEMLLEDLDALDELALAELLERDFARGEDIADLAVLPDAVRMRLLRLAALEAGCPTRDLTRGHVESVERLIPDGPGERLAIDLPGPVRAVREGDLLRLERTGASRAGDEAAGGRPPPWA